ncbi:MAG: F0F1 ATP synthase subunit A [Parvularculaceae bacterium]
MAGLFDLVGLLLQHHPLDFSIADPMEQFEIVDIIPLKIGDINISFSNAALSMAMVLLVACAFMSLATRKVSLVPGRMQSLGETLHGFVADTLREMAGNEGMKFFPYIFTLFLFIFLANLLGLLPTLPGIPHWAHVFTPTSHLAVTLTLAMITILIVIVYGLYKNGFKFFKLFAPSGVPLWLLPLIIVIEFVSFLSRPLSLAIRLFANMFAGHLILKLFAGFTIALLGAAGAMKGLAIFPILGSVAVYLLEILVAFLQAYIFAVLSSMYLGDALHPDH